jgi:hypothetical protein
MKNILFILLLAIFSCKEKYPLFKTVEKHIQGFDEDVANEKIDSAYRYIEVLMESYKKALKTFGVNPIYYDTFYLTNKKEISAELYLSATREFIIYVYQSKERKFTINATLVPAQTALTMNDLPGLVDQEKRRRLLLYYDSTKSYPSNAPFPAGMRQYQYDDGSWPLSAGRFILRGTFVPSHNSFGFRFFSGGRFLDLSKIYGPVYLSGVDVVDKDDTSKLKRFSDKGIAVIKNSIDIDSATYFGMWGGNTLAREEMVRLYFDSENFRIAMANQELGPIAREIQNKWTRVNVDKEYTGYDSLQFVMDRQKLNDLARQYNIKWKDADFFNNIHPKIIGGRFLWYYDSYSCFMWQWLIANLAVHLFAIVYKFKRIEKKSWGPILKISGFWGLALTVNGFAIANRPEGLPILPYFVPPFIILIASYCVLWIIKDDNEPANAANSTP